MWSPRRSGCRSRTCGSSCPTSAAASGRRVRSILKRSWSRPRRTGSDGPSSGWRAAARISRAWATTANTLNHLPGPYRVPHYRNAGTSVVTTKAVNAAYRAAGRPEAVFVMERLMDLGARRLGLDPAEIRRRNFVRPAEMPYRPGLTYKDGVPIAYDPGDFPRAFERALA